MAVDVGAHRGETCRSLLQIFPDVFIHAFEPVRDNYQCLVSAMHGEDQVSCHPVALGATPGALDIVLQADSQTHSLRHQFKGGLETKVPHEQVQVWTLDDFAFRESIARIDLLKIDTEGYEIEVLRGAKTLLTERRVGAILLEATLDPNDEVHTHLGDAIRFLSEHHHHLASIGEQVIWSGPVRLAYFNALFVLDAYSSG
jgi:FkbM family methyltransferase